MTEFDVCIGVLYVSTLEYVSITPFCFVETNK